MQPTSKILGIGPIVAIVLAVAAGIPTAPAPQAAGAGMSTPPAAPLVVAQGRCFNGKCY